MGFGSGTSFVSSFDKAGAPRWFRSAHGRPARGNIRMPLARGKIGPLHRSRPKSELPIYGAVSRGLKRRAKAGVRAGDRGADLVELQVPIAAGAGQRTTGQTPMAIAKKNREIGWVIPALCLEGPRLTGIAPAPSTHRPGFGSRCLRRSPNLLSQAATFGRYG